MALGVSLAAEPFTVDGAGDTFDEVAATDLAREPLEQTDLDPVLPKQKYFENKFELRILHFFK